MRANFTQARRLWLITILCLAFQTNELLAQTSTGVAGGVGTFQCIGVTWSGSGGSANTVCNVKYRIAGTTTWKDGYPLTFDSRAAGSGTSAARPANEYRGSLVGLTPGTTYEIQLSLQGTSTANTFTCATWSETFPIGGTHIVSNTSSTLNITTGGSASAYELYTPAAGTTATINANNAATNCIYINAAYVIIRGLTLQGAKVDAIKLGPNAHDIVIENNDISGWGTVMSDGFGQNGDAAIRVVNSPNVSRIIIQRNKIHHPRTNSNSWAQNRPLYGTNHPLGPLAVNFETAGGNHVIRYNTIWSDATHYFMDAIGGAENFSYEGFPRANSDVNGNKISQAWDDGIECEGGNMNVRIWGNYLDSTYVKVATAATAVGPVYIFRNVANVSRYSSATDANTADNEDRGPFLKAGSQDAAYRGGKIYVFHNTLLQPTFSGYSYTLGCGGGLIDAAGGPMTPVVSRNNILIIHKNWWQSIGDDFASQTTNDFNYDLYNGTVTGSNGQEANGWSGTPTYSTSNPPGVWALASNSKGYNVGQVLNNFNDNYIGTGPDVGAYEAGAPPLEFGVNAYLPPTNVAISANAGNDITMILPTNSTTLTGTGTTTTGSITGYSWAQVSGPATFTLANASGASTGLSGLVQGIYVFRLTVTNTGGATATDDVTVTVNAPANQPPTANAGGDITITLPINITTLIGSANDPDGTIASYSWARVSGPATFALGTPTALTTTLINLVQGTYVFQLTVKDNSGATATDNVTVIVQAAINLPPTANAGNNIVITLPTNSTTLTGIGTDVDGTIASYAWTWVSGPTTYTIGSPAAATTALTNLVVGTYTFRLTIKDNSGATATDDVTVTVNPAPNQAPTANAGNDITITLPTNSTTLSGSGTDPDGTITSYTWSWVSGPATYTIGTPNASTTPLTGLIAGTYVFKLTVKDNSGATATDNVTVTVNPAPNQQPTANAGPNIVITLPVNSTTLNGSGTDPDGTIASYTWSWISGPTTYTIGSPNTAATPLNNLVAGTYTFRLTVKDNKGATSSDDVVVTVNPAVPNQPPTANAGNNIVITLPVNSTTLNGSGSDPDGTIASYAWSWVNGPTTYTIGSPNTAQTALTNLVVGTYTFRLTVKDNSGATATDDVTVTVNAAPPVNQSPIANAGANITITLPVNSTTLNGTGSSDPDGSITNYTWSWVSGPTTYTIVTPNAATTSLTGLVAGTYVFRLTVKDNNGATTTDDVTVIVNPLPNQPPVANAGNNIVITLPVNSVILNGTGSIDPDGSIASYTWSWVSGPATYTISNATAASTGVVNLVQGTYVFRLTVKDNKGAIATDDVTVTVNPAANQPPTANAGNNITLTLPTNSTTLNGSGSSDPDGSITTYTWTWVSGPATYTLGSANSPITALTGLVQGTYVFRLTVKDNSGTTSSDDVTVTVNASNNIPPISNAGNNIILTLPTNTTTLNGNSSTDPDGTIASYLWSWVSGPTAYAIGTPNAATTTLTGLVQGTYIFRLTVTDNKGATNSDNVTVTVNSQPASVNHAPVVNAGSDIIVMLPANAAALTGTATDPDGTIASYSWTKVSGPASFALTSANSATTGLTGLVQGTYVFKLTVTDNMGASSSDNVTVSVLPAVTQGNQPPIARTNADVTIKLPTNSTQLFGNTSTDPDGVIVSYKWRQISGPMPAVFGNDSAAVTTISNLTTGTYTFELKVTDDKGATATKTMKVTVQNQPGQGATLIIYPNPTQGPLNVQYVSNVNGQLRISIYDIQRKLIKEQVVDKNQVSIVLTIDMSSVESGTYLIQVTSSDKKQETITKQFVKM